MTNSCDSTHGLQPAARAASCSSRIGAWARRCSPCFAISTCPLRSALSGQATTYAAAFAIAADHWRVAPAAALKGLMWTIAEGQVAAAMRLVRLGHTAGQRILIEAVPAIERSVAMARTIEDDEIGNVSVAMAMACAWHETQYSRLFRSSQTDTRAMKARSMLSPAARTRVSRIAFGETEAVSGGRWFRRG